MSERASCRSGLHVEWKDRLGLDPARIVWFCDASLPAVTA